MRSIGIILVLTCLICSCEKSKDVPCSNQFIIAGASNNCFEIIDIEPDSAVSAFSELNGLKKSLKSTYESHIDMGQKNENGFWNKTGNIDFQFLAYYSTAGGKSITYQGVDLLTIDNNFLEYLHYYLPFTTKY
jgi:hypothetical protein